MVATNLKAQTMELMEKRTAMEEEMNAIINSLTQPGGPGLSGNLLDSEGFPLPEIDIPVVRANRRRLAELRNDHKDITEKINQNIQILHSLKHERPSAGVDDSGIKVHDVITPSFEIPLRGSSGMQVDSVVGRPFVVIDEITELSPAAEDGLQLGDQIVMFGDVDAGENLLPRLSNEVQNKQGQSVPVVLIRQGTPVNILVTPRTWAGRGLLGCHFRVL